MISDYTLIILIKQCYANAHSFRTKRDVKSRKEAFVVKRRVIAAIAAASSVLGCNLEFGTSTKRPLFVEPSWVVTPVPAEQHYFPPAQPLYPIIRQDPSGSPSPSPSATTAVTLKPTPSPSPTQLVDNGVPEILDYVTETKDRFTMENDYLVRGKDRVKFYSSSAATFSVDWALPNRPIPVSQGDDGAYVSVKILAMAFSYIGETICVIAEGRTQTKKVCALVGEFDKSSPGYRYKLSNWSVSVTPTATQ